MRFADRVAIVTGAAGGIGLAVAKAFGAEGARVALVDLDRGRSEEAAAAVRAAGAPDAIGLACDVADEAQVVAACQAVLARWQRLDVVVNNAGLMVFKPLEEHEAEDWIRVLRVDLLGAFFFTKQAFLSMKGGGAIVNVSSVHAVETTPHVASYAAAKAALLSLTRSSAIEGKDRGIRVNAVLPGAVDTPMLWNNPNIRAGLETIDTADVGKPEDVAAAILFLADPCAQFVQGADLRVDGGRLSRL
jgi:NAD(P)-dependent dehydrogenase (short-subunit alcohol dehydrogenase family)